MIWTRAPTALAEPVAFLVSVDGMTGGSNVPTEFTCDGANETPAVTIEGVYGIKLFGLSSALGLDWGLDGRAIAGSIVSDALLIASYERASD